MTAYSPGTCQWCEEDGRIEATIGGLTVYLTPTQIEAWNCGELESDPLEIRCHLPTHQPDKSHVRDGEVVVHLGLPSDWYGTIGEAIDDGLLAADYYEQSMEGCEIEAT